MSFPCNLRIKLIKQRLKFEDRVDCVEDRVRGQVDQLGNVLALMAIEEVNGHVNS